MSYSTWHFITPSPSLGWLFRNMVLPRFVSLWQAMLRRHNDMRFDCLDIVTIWLLYQYCAWCTHLQHSTNSDYKLHTAPCGRNRWDLFWRRATVVLSTPVVLLRRWVTATSSVPPSWPRLSQWPPPSRWPSGRPRFCCPVNIFFRRWPNLGTPLDHSELQSL